MKLSVSLTEKDVEFLDLYVTEHDLDSRSAAIRAALRTLRDLEMADDYASTFMEREDPKALAEWHRMWVESGGPLFPEGDIHPDDRRPR
jgi:Arc/MetJ-type ribon-helix-helix transcriptional regulator